MFQGKPYCFQHKSGKSAICPLDCLFHLLHQRIGKTDGLGCAGRGFGYFTGNSKPFHRAFTSHTFCSIVASSFGKEPVSYTHLDVYKRQAEGHTLQHVGQEGGICTLAGQAADLLVVEQGQHGDVLLRCV